MPKYKNISPLGALELPLIGRVVERGEVITVTTTQARHLAGQTDAWQPVKGAPGTQDPAEVPGPQDAADGATTTQGEGEGA
ncbi:hypothetical protein [Cellulomonas timonensis]|uniref:hypothetical protein n=1 Tax=Cellulomonas timonensis TaxID=1689271 RepID=UPI00083687C6|nr:hypothetical protein [Cellulomonas timonensis]